MLTKEDLGVAAKKMGVVKLNKMLASIWWGQRDSRGVKGCHGRECESTGIKVANLI